MKFYMKGNASVSTIRAYFLYKENHVFIHVNAYFKKEITVLISHRQLVILSFMH